MLMLAALFAVLPQRFVSNDALQPHTYKSASGQWSLYVDPSSRDGAGKSTLSISNQGVVKWTGEKPFTFHDAVIDDSGISAGYAYSAGTEGRHDKDGEYVVGSLVIALLGADGETLLVDETPRESRNEMHMPPQPCVRQILLHPGLHSAIFRLDQPGADDFSECWFVYTLSPAKKLEPVRGERELKAAEQQVFAFAIAAIRGTPLTLAHWHTPGEWNVRGSGPGSEFALYDESWKLVWSLPLPGDLQLQDDGEEWKLFEEIRDSGAILDTASEGRFEVRFVKESERVGFEAVRDSSAAKGWSVREVSRAPFKADAPSKPRAAAKLELVELPEAGKVALNIQGRYAPGPVRDIYSLRIDTSDRITFVRGEETPEAVTLVTINGSGAVQRQVAVAPIESQLDGTRRWSALPGGDWLLTVSPWEGEDPPSRAWRIQADTGSPRELVEFHAPEIESIEAMADGGFVAIATHHRQHTSSAELSRCAADGSRMWSIDEVDYSDDPADFYAPRDVAVDKDGTILVLDQIRRLVQFFDANGKFAKSINLKDSWESDFSFLTDLVLEPSGSLLIFDSHDKGTWHRISRDGKQLATIAPRRENGSTEGLYSSVVQVDAGGTLWCQDGRQIFEYDAQGVLHARFGSPTDPVQLLEIDRTFCDGSGRFALVDRQTHAVHIFAQDGSRVAVCIPGPTDFDDERTVDSVFTAPDGTIYVQPNERNDRYLAFNAEGKRIGSVELGGTRVAFSRRTKDRWAGGDGVDDVVRLRRFAADGKLAFETDRRPDGGFFESIKALACLADGSVVVLDGSTDSMGDGAPGLLCFFGAKGDPQKQWKLPGSQIDSENFMQVGRRWIVISGYEPMALLVSLVDGKCTMFNAPDQEAVWSIGLSPDEAELWGLEWTVLHRFTLPK